jgi:hypothetical protein
VACPCDVVDPNGGSGDSREGEIKGGGHVYCEAWQRRLMAMERARGCIDGRRGGSECAVCSWREEWRGSGA